MKTAINLLKYIKRYYESINYAIEGILHSARTQKHVRLHLFSAAFLLLFCFALGIDMHDFIILSIMAAIVIVAEMLNSAIEAAVDIASPNKSEMARISKDMAAGAVFVAAVFSLVVAFYILKPYFIKFYYEGISLTKHYPSDIMVAAILMVLIAVIILKAYFGKGHPLKGGFPSGHSAISSSVAVSTIFLTENYYIIITFFILAVIISIARYIYKIHSVIEIFCGFFLGTFLTLILYNIFM